jgi:hypothetical protein
MKVKRVMVMVGLAMMLLIGCVSSKNWVRKDGQSMDMTVLEQDVYRCNRGWTTALVTDIFLSAGIASLLHYFEASRCMALNGYVYVREPKELAKVESAQGGTLVYGESVQEPPKPLWWRNQPPWQKGE